MDRTNRQKNKQLNIYSFILASLCMLLFMLFKGVIGFGQYSLLEGDIRLQYIPAIKNLVRCILHGENPYYTWTIGMGMNISMFNAYYAINPFNILYVILGFLSDNTVTAIIIILKTGLAAMCFHLFVSKVHQIDDHRAVCFSILYSMCSFQVAYNITNIIWLDAVWILPLILWGIDSLIEKKKWIMLTLSFAYIFATQFFMGYILGITGTIYFILRLHLREGSQDVRTGRAWLRYIASVILAACLSAFVWVPALSFLINNGMSSSSEFTELGISISDIWNQFYFGSTDNSLGGVPYIYCGIPVVMTVPAYFAAGNVSLKEKIQHGIILLLLILSCMWLPLYKIWHCFREPNGWTFRFAFVLSAFMCIVGVKGACKLNENRKKVYLSAVIVNTLLIAVANVISKGGIKRVDVTDIRHIIINVLIMTVWFIVLNADADTNYERKKAYEMLLVTLVCTECICNGYFLVQKNQEFKPKFTMQLKTTLDGYQNELVRQLPESDDFSRVAVRPNIGPNMSMYYDYNSIGYFSSVENNRLRETLHKLGVWSSPRSVFDYGITSVTEMLFDIKYTAGIETKQYTMKVDETGNDIGLGFMIAGDPEDYKLSSTNAFVNNNELLSLMLGEPTEVYRPVEDGAVQASIKDLELYSDDKGLTLEISDSLTQEERADSYLEFDVNTDSDNCYAYIDNAESETISPTFLIDGEENFIYDDGCVNVSYISRLKQTESGFSLKIMPDKKVTSQTFGYIIFFTMDEEIMADVKERLSQYSFEIEECKNGYIKGSVSNPEKDGLLFLSVPYDKGWKARIDGAPAEIEPILDDTYMAVRMPEAGQHEIELEFDACGAKAGIILSMIGVFITIIVIKKEKRRNNVSVMLE
ncbi:MAG: YfhO family protein [Lachnospiraceae bacterium]|nr:YfhO family protein [Lachnospiraceae bacterium]